MKTILVLSDHDLILLSKMQYVVHGWVVICTVPMLRLAMSRICTFCYQVVIER